MRHIKKFEQYQVNEEGWLQNILLASTLLFTNIDRAEASNIEPKKSTEISVSTSLDANILICSTSSEEVSNSLLQKKFGLPKGTNRYWTCTVGELKSSFNRDSSQILSCFKPYSGVNITSTDYIRIGNEELSEILREL